MSEATEIDTRVTRLENEMAQVRYLAKRADRDVSDLRATLNGHTGVLNAIGETLRDHGLQLADHGSRLGRLERKVDQLDRKVDDGFARMNEGFDQANKNFDTIDKRFVMVQAGIMKITDLLTTNLDEPEEG